MSYPDMVNPKLVGYPTKEIEPEVEPRETGLTMRVIGWTLLVHDALFVAVFAPGGARDGSLLFPIWMVVQGLLGIVLAVEGARKEDLVTELEGRVVTMPVLRLEEPPRRVA